MPIPLRDIHVLEVLSPVVDTPATARREVKKISPEAVAEATLDALAAQEPRWPSPTL